MITNMNEQEFLSCYGDAEVVFISYCKNSFLFVGEYDEKKIEVRVSGIDQIYYMQIEANKKYIVRDLGITYGCVYQIAIVMDRFDANQH